MRQLFLTTSLAVFALSFVLAQGQPADPDKMVQGSGALPGGFAVRLDNGSTTPEGVEVMEMGGGLHFMTGPAGIYYRAADTKSGSYTVSATFTQLSASDHPEAYGLFIGGSGLTGASQKYTYFLIRQDGKYLVKRRNGSETPTLFNWADNTAVKRTADATKGVNTLSIEVTPDLVRFLVNGTEVASSAADGVDTSGIAGLRVNHNLNLQVNDFTIK